MYLVKRTLVLQPILKRNSIMEAVLVIVIVAVLVVGFIKVAKPDLYDRLRAKLPF